MYKQYSAYHSSVSGHLSCLQFLTVENNVALNMSVKYFFHAVFGSFGCVPKNRIAGSYGNSNFNVLRNCHLVFQSSYTILHSN